MLFRTHISFAVGIIESETTAPRHFLHTAIIVRLSVGFSQRCAEIHATRKTCTGILERLHRGNENIHLSYAKVVAFNGLARQPPSML